MEKEREEMMDFITGYGALERQREEFNKTKRVYRIFTVIEIIICMLAIKLFVL